MVGDGRGGHQAAETRNLRYALSEICRSLWYWRDGSER
jgi:hypothetical protein